MINNHTISSIVAIMKLRLFGFLGRVVCAMVGFEAGCIGVIGVCDGGRLVFWEALGVLFSMKLVPFCLLCHDQYSVFAGRWYGVLLSGFCY